MKKGEKMFKIVLFVIISIIGILLVLWGILESFIFPNNYPSYLSNAQWGAFISTYFAGTLGGVIALLGISYQLKQDKESINEQLRLDREKIENEKTEKLNRLKNYVKYFIKKNIESVHFEEMLILSEIQISYNRNLLGEDLENDTKFLFEFDNNYIQNNIDQILKLGDIGEEILDLNSKVITFNKLYNKVLNNLNNKNNCLKKLETDPQDDNFMKILTFFLKKYSTILNSVIGQEDILDTEANGMFEVGESQFDRLIYISSYKNFKDTLTSNFSNYNTLDFKKRLEKITEANQSFIKFNLFLLNNIDFNPNHEELKTELYKYSILNRQLTGCALGVFNMITKIQNEL